MSRNTKLSYDPKDIINDYLNNVGTKELSLKYGKSQSQIGNILKSSGVVLRRKNKISSLCSDYTKDQILELYNSKNRSEIAEILGITKNSITHVLHHFGIDKHSVHFKEKRLKQLDTGMNNPFKVLTPESMYLLGYIYGDGSISSRDYEYSKHRLNISSKDISILENFCYEFEWSPSNLSKTYSKKFKTYCNVLILSDYYIYQSLLELGLVPNKSQLGCFIPKRVLESKYLNHFVRGLFDSDGNVGSYDYNNYKLNFRIYGHITYISQLYEYLPNYLWHFKNTSKYLYQISLHTQSDMLDLYNYLYGESPKLFLSRKKEIFEYGFTNRGVKF